jgi:transposase
LTRVVFPEAAGALRAIRHQRGRIAIPAPERCPRCGSPKMSKLGEDITETLEVIPRQWR